MEEKENAGLRQWKLGVLDGDYSQNGFGIGIKTHSAAVNNYPALTAW